MAKDSMPLNFQPSYAARLDDWDPVTSYKQNTPTLCCRQCKFSLVVAPTEGSRLSAHLDLDT
jgi:hypothetical protein